MKIKLKDHARQLWLSLLLLVGVAAIAVPGLNGTNSGNVARIGSTEYATLQEAVTAAQQLGGSQTIYLIDNVSEETVTIQEVANFKLTISGQKDASSNYTVDAKIVVDGLRKNYGGGGSPTNGASVTIQNIDFVNNAAKDVINPNGYPHHLTIQDCTYTGSTTSLKNWFVNVTDGPLYGATIKNVTVESSRLIQGDFSSEVVFESIVATNNAYVGFNIKTGDSGGHTGTVLIKDCQVTTEKYAFRDISDDYNGTITLEGNIFISTSTESDEGAIVNRGGLVGTGHINVVSGTYNGPIKVLNNKEGVLAISGGYFSEEFPQEYIAADLVAQGKVCTPATDMEGYFTIGDPHYVAQIGETGYVSLQAALDAAYAMTGDVTIELIDNITGYSIIKQKKDLNLTIDGKEKTLNGQIIIDGDGGSTRTETLTIKDIKFVDDKSNFYTGTDAFILVPNTKATGTPYYNNSNNYAHNVTVTNCSFTSTSSAYDVVGLKSNSGGPAMYNLVLNENTGTNLHSLAQLNATNGGTITGNIVSGGESFVNVTGGGDNIAISGNTFTSAEGADGYGIRENGSSSAAITLTDNTFTAAKAVVLGKSKSATNGTINVVSGTYVGDIVKDIAATATGKIAISGGKFSAPLGNEAYADFIADGYMGMNNIYSDEATPNGVVSTDKAVMYTATNGSVTFYDALPNAFSSGTYKLLKDITRTTRMTPGIMATDVTLDLNGHTLTSTATDCAILLSRAGTSSKPKTFNLIDTSDEKGGILKVNPAVNIGIEVSGAYNQVTIGEGVTIDGDCVALLGSNQTLTVNGTINGGNDFAVATNGSSTKNATITINEGAVLTSDVAAMYLPGNEGLTATINGGTITGGNTGIELRAGQLIVNGGDITSTATEYGYTPNGNGTTTKGAAIAVVQHNTKLPIDAQILGGTLTGLNQIAVVDAQENSLEDVSVRAKDDLIVTTTIPDAFKWVSNGDGTSSLAPRDAVAQIGETKYYSLADAVAAVPADGSETTITMIADEAIDVVGYAITIPATKNVVLDLAGHTVAGQCTTGKTSALILNLGSLKIEDSSSNGKLTMSAEPAWVYSEADPGGYASNLIRNEKELVVESGNLYNYGTGSACYAIDNYSAGNVTINGGEVDAAKASAIRMFYVNGGSITVNDGIIGRYNSDDDCTYMGVQVQNGTNANVTITGGTIAGQYAFYGNNTGGNVAISGGTLDGYVMFGSAGPNDISITGGAHYYVYAYGSQTKFVSGGIYTYEVDEEYIADGCILTNNTDPATKDEYPYMVKQGSFICAIGTTKYETLAEAVAAAGTAETTITLLTEAATDGVITGNGVKVEAGQNITFDLNGLTYNVDKTVGSSGTETNGFQLLKGSTVKFTNGTVTSNTAQILLQNYSDLTLDGVNVNAGSADYAVSNNFGSLTVTGETNINAKSGGCAFDLWYGMYAVYDDGISVVFDENFTGSVTGKVEYGHHSRVTDENWREKTKLEIKAGKFDIEFVNSSTDALNGANISISGGIFAEKPADEYCADGYIVTDNTDEETKDAYPFTVKSKEDAGIFELKDWEVYPYLSYTEDKEAASVTYIRRFGNTNWQALYIPFDINDISELTDKYEFAKIHMVALENDGQWTTGDDKIEVYYTKMTEGKIHANKPYLIKPKNTGEQSIVVENTILHDTHNIKPMQTETTAAVYAFTGTYEGVDATSSNTFFAMGGGTINFCDNVHLGAYRWYLNFEPKTDDYAKPIIDFIESDSDATGVSSVKTGDDTDIEGYYNINGVRSETPVRGVNIIRYKNGSTRKVVIK